MLLIDGIFVPNLLIVYQQGQDVRFLLKIMAKNVASYTKTQYICTVENLIADCPRFQQAC